MSRKLTLAFIALATLALLLGACSTATPAPAPTTAPAATEAPVAAPSEAIKIGFFSPTTGFAAADGTSALQSAQLAVKMINDAGGVLGQPLELVYYDDGAKPDQASAIARKLIEQDKVVAGIQRNQYAPIGERVWNQLPENVPQMIPG